MDKSMSLETPAYIQRCKTLFATSLEAKIVTLVWMYEGCVKAIHWFNSTKSRGLRHTKAELKVLGRPRLTPLIDAEGSC